MPTLDSFFPEGATRGDGRKFVNPVWNKDYWFEPIFKTKIGTWVGLNPEGGHDEVGLNPNWQEYKEPPKTKKVKMYQPIIKRKSQEVYFLGDWASFKLDTTDTTHEIIGWLEQEVTVTE